MNILKVKRTNGSVVYKAVIRIKGTNKRETKRFSNKALAEKWIIKRLTELEYESVNGKKNVATVLDAITEYQAKYIEKFGRSKKADMERLKNYDIANVPIAELSTQHIIKHCIERNRTAKPQTVLNDVIWLKLVVHTHAITNNFSYDATVFERANILLRKQKLIGKPESRDRLLTLAEMLKLARQFKQSKSSIPMYDIFLFALSSCRRSSEITRLRWGDNNATKQTGMVRDLKHPTKKDGNHKRFKYDQIAWRVVCRQPKTSDYIFDYNNRTIESYFAKACKLLDIKDCHFHDLRHCGITRLAKKLDGNIDKLRHYSLHEDYKSLKRYVNTKPEDF